MTDTIHGAMSALVELAEGPMAEKVGQLGLFDGTPLHVTRYKPRQSNWPALWHEARPAQSAPADTSHMRDVLYVAVMLGVRHGDQGQAPEEIERLLDAARLVYDHALQGRGSLDCHTARRVGIEQPVQTEINGVSLYVAGVLLRVELHASVLPL